MVSVTADRNIPHNNEEDWAARARAWASAKTEIENQHPQSQFTPVDRPEEHNHVYHDQYQQTIDPHYTDIHQSSLPSSSYQQFAFSAPNLHRSPANHLQESTSFSSGPSSYVSDGHLSYTARDGALAADSNPVYLHQESVPTSSSIYQQEVPSSYSSVTGNALLSILNLCVKLVLKNCCCGTYYRQDSTYAVYDFSLRLACNESNDSLQSGRRMIHSHVLHMDPSFFSLLVKVDLYFLSLQCWISVASGSITQDLLVKGFKPKYVENSFGVAFISRFYFPFFFLTFILYSLEVYRHMGMIATVACVNRTAKYFMDPNFVRIGVVYPAVPPIPSGPQEDPFQPIGDESIDKSPRQSYQTDSKSIESSRTTEDDDDDDEVISARTAAINQEIKRVLTEVLLKVTDELFDEIATKVLCEDDLTVEVDQSTATPNHKVSPSPPSIPTPKASAKVLIPIKAKETEAEDVSGKSSSSSPGDVLGLGNYASDDDGEIDSSSMPNTRQTDSVHQQSSIEKLSEDIPETVENGSSQAEIERYCADPTNVESDHNKTCPSGHIHNHSVLDVGLSDNRVDVELDHENNGTPSSVKGVLGILGEKINVEVGKMAESSNAFVLKDTVREMACMNPELPGRNFSVKSSMTDDSQGKEARNKSDKNGHESKSSAGKDFIKNAESGKARVDEKHSDSIDRRRRDEKNVRKEKTHERNGSKERVKEQSVKPGEKAKETGSRKKSIHVNSKDDRKESERVKRASAKEDSNRKRERVKDERGDRSRHKGARHKRQRSSSVGSRASEDSKKRFTIINPLSLSLSLYLISFSYAMHSKRRSLSPSPTRFRRRQVSRSPHSKHSQRRHSPYSSLETTRYFDRVWGGGRGPIHPSIGEDDDVKEMKARRKEGKTPNIPLRGHVAMTFDYRVECLTKFVLIKVSQPLQLTGRGWAVGQDHDHALGSGGPEFESPPTVGHPHGVIPSYLVLVGLWLGGCCTLAPGGNSQAFQVGLWSVWLSGFLLIGLSLYATQRLPSLKNQIKKPILHHREWGRPNITIFSAPRPFNGSIGASQVLAVRSWLALSPDVSVVLFGRDPSVLSLAGALGSRVSVEPNIDFT
ncbi:hypothetical protein HHK36_029570 [Tetracentron sinense]|uniref:Uncharacterized protein n=1 Tax=Tetracentron sinense TaxID=13715 RepID=A0A834Y9U6_TETSI|nr:hypothetical protein HHK36_029570 [Tetracentron sinense]